MPEDNNSQNLTPPASDPIRKTLVDEVVVCLAVALGILASLLLAVMNVVYDYNFWPSFIAFLASISVAALIYRFLGGGAGNELTMGAMKLGGSAAILFGMTWFLGDKLKDQMGMLDSEEAYRAKITGLTAETRTLSSDNETLKSELASAKASLTEASDRRTRSVMEEIRAKRPDDNLIIEIRRMVINKNAPFVDTVNETTAKVALVDMKFDEYRICKDAERRIFKDMNNPTNKLRFTRSVSVSYEPVVVDLTRNGHIEDKYCGNDFEVQLTCPNLIKLFPDKIVRCNGKQPTYRDGDIRGESIAVASVLPD